LSQVLQWHRTKADTLQDFYASTEGKGFSDLAESPEWWLTLFILHEQFSLIRKALTAMQVKGYLLDMQREMLNQLGNDISRLHCVAYRREDDGEVQATQDGEYCDPEHTPKICTTGNGLETRASLGWFKVNYKDIISKTSEYGFDARVEMEELLALSAN
jgi:hypothetical protein